MKRYVRREEIARELQACNEAITDAGSRFGVRLSDFVGCHTERLSYTALCANPHVPGGSVDDERVEALVRTGGAGTGLVGPSDDAKALCDDM